MASVQIEEAKLPIANLKRSEHDNLQSDLRGGTNRLFFEVPLIKEMPGGKLVKLGPNDPWLKDFVLR
jgi:hypothetical protein